MSKKLRNTAFSLGGLVFIFLLFGFVLRPLMEKINKVQQDVKLAEARVRKGLTVQAKKDDIIKEYKIYKFYLNQKGISERQKLGNFLKELERISQEANLSITNLNPRDTKTEEEILLYSADLKAEGDIEEILFFFSKVQESKLLVRVDKFSLSPKGKSANLLIFDAKIGMFLLQE